jgi:hypothetical protein
MALRRAWIKASPAEPSERLACFGCLLRDA